MLLRLSHEIINYAIAPDKQYLYFVAMSKHPTISKKKNGINALKYNTNRGGPVFRTSLPLRSALIAAVHVPGLQLLVLPKGVAAFGVTVLC